LSGSKLPSGSLSNEALMVRSRSESGSTWLASRWIDPQEYPMGLPDGGAGGRVARIEETVTQAAPKRSPSPSRITHSFFTVRFILILASSCFEFPLRRCIYPDGGRSANSCFSRTVSRSAQPDGAVTDYKAAAIINKIV